MVDKSVNQIELFSLHKLNFYTFCIIVRFSRLEKILPSNGIKTPKQKQSLFFLLLLLLFNIFLCIHQNLEEKNRNHLIASRDFDQTNSYVICNIYKSGSCYFTRFCSIFFCLFFSSLCHFPNFISRSFQL